MQLIFLNIKTEIYDMQNFNFCFYGHLLCSSQDMCKIIDYRNRPLEANEQNHYKQCQLHRIARISTKQIRVRTDTDNIDLHKRYC